LCGKIRNRYLKSKTIYAKVFNTFIALAACTFRVFYDTDWISPLNAASGRTVKPNLHTCMRKIGPFLSTLAKPQGKFEKNEPRAALAVSACVPHRSGSHFELNSSPAQLFNQASRRNHYLHS